MAAPSGDEAADRDAFRAALVARIPRWYSPWGHLAFPAVVGLGLAALALSLVRHLRPVELLTIPAVWVISNAFEWRVHKYVLHRRTPMLELLFERHTPEHHRIFVEQDMAMRSTREFRLVLIPAYGILLIALVDLPPTALLWWLGLRNVALLFMATSLAYLLSYEWLHLCYHLPLDSRIGGSRLIARLRRHHAIHHTPERMQKWNFNVTLPLWDYVRGTTWKGDPPV